MIKLNAKCEWNKPYRKKNKKELIASIDISADMIAEMKKKETKPLNVAFVIDTSGSMSQKSGKENSGNNINDFVSDSDKNNIFRKYFHNENLFNYKTKLQRVVEAVIVSIKMLKENDCFSIVSFDDNVNLAFPSQYATEKAKKEAFNILNGLKTGGCTMLFNGWEAGVKSLSERVSDKFNNRVMLLTDGVSTDNVQEEVYFRIAKKLTDIEKISTTTFGVGENFNEDFLISLSQSADGNSYFLDEKSDYKEIFIKEINEFSLVVGRNVSFSFKGIDFENLEMLNDFKEENGVYTLPNLIKDQKIKILFKGDAIGKSALIKLNIVFSGSNNNQKHINIIDCNVDISEIDYHNKDVENEAVKLKIAMEQKVAAKEMKNGNKDRAELILKRALNLTTELNEKDRSYYTDVLNSSKKEMIEGNLGMASKIMAYSSYATINSKR